MFSVPVRTKGLFAHLFHFGKTARWIFCCKWFEDQAAQFPWEPAKEPDLTGVMPVLEVNRIVPGSSLVDSGEHLFHIPRTAFVIRRCPDRDEHGYRIPQSEPYSEALDKNKCTLSDRK